MTQLSTLCPGRTTFCEETIPAYALFVLGRNWMEMGTRWMGHDTLQPRGWQAGHAPPSAVVFLLC